MKTLGCNIKKRRKELKISRSKLAEKSSIAESTLRDLENYGRGGHVILNKLAELSETLDISIDDLFNTNRASCHECLKFAQIYCSLNRSSRDKIKNLASQLKNAA